MDETPATIDMLPACAKAAQGRIRIHIDGGIRSGVDIFKALALGAECCWVGRPMLWGLAVGYLHLECFNLEADMILDSMMVRKELRLC